MENKLKIGDWIKADIIGLSFYEVVNIDDFNLSLKCLKIFGRMCDSIGHITCCHHGTDKRTNKKIKIDQSKWFSLKIKRINDGK